MEENIEGNVLFTNFISGVKGIPLNTIMLLIDDTPNKSLNFMYNIDGNKIMKFPIETIKNITFKSRVRMQNSDKKVEENETKSMLLSAAVFGGNPLMQFAGNSGFNSLFESMSNNYDKVDYDSYYEITIEATINNQDFRIVLTSDTNPEEFINKILLKNE